MVVIVISLFLDMSLGVADVGVEEKIHYQPPMVPAEPVNIVVPAEDKMDSESSPFTLDGAKAFLSGPVEQWTEGELTKALSVIGLEGALKAIGAKRIPNPYEKDGETIYFHDDKGDIIPCAFVVRTREIDKAARLLTVSSKKIMMMGALTSATGNFNIPGVPKPINDIYGIQAETVLSENLIKEAAADAPYLRSDEVRLNFEKGTVEVGAGIPPLLLNEWLANRLGPEYCFPTDATTKGILHLAAGFATGAQGPSRIKIDEYTASITMSDGKRSWVVEGEALRDHMGMLGKTGAITAVELELVTRPEHVFGAFVPLLRAKAHNWSKKVAALSTALQDSLQIQLAPAEDGKKGKKLVSKWKHGVVMGMEEMTRQSLEIAAKKGHAKADEFLRMLGEDSDMGIFMTGFSDLDQNGMANDDTSPISILYTMTPAIRGDDPSQTDESDEETSAQAKDENKVDIGDLPFVGDDIGFYANTTILREVDALREEFPMSAREEGRKREDMLVHTLSTDVNTRILNPNAYNLNELRVLFSTMYQPYLNLEKEVEKLRIKAEQVDVKVRMHRYGHLHANSPDLHRRVNVWAEKSNETHYRTVVDELKALHHQWIAQILALREGGQIEVLPGEKGLNEEAWAFMTEAQRAKVIQTLAKGPVVFQASLKGTLAEEVTALRAA